MKTQVSFAVATGVAVTDTALMSETLETIVRRYHSELVRILTARLRSEQDAADLAQEAYARVLRYQGECSGDDLRRMLFRIAQNLLNDHWRWRRSRGVDTHVPLDELLDVDNGLPGPDRELSGEQQLARLEEMILRMPRKRRTVFVLSRIHGFTNIEIAKRCGISAKTVEKHIAIALAECRAKVGDDDLQTL
jgi:RNA polymerase sigma-70 factor (ECF subfamily)